MKKKILLLSLLFSIVTSVYAGEDWLAKESSLVKEYLLNLRNSDIGQTQKGVLLPYNMNPIKGSVYLGKLKIQKEGVVIFMFKKSNNKHSFLWKDTAGEYILPVCEQLVGAGSFVLSGDVYTFKHLSKESGVVENICQDAVWYR